MRGFLGFEEVFEFLTRFFTFRVSEKVFEFFKRSFEFFRRSFGFLRRFLGFQRTFEFLTSNTNFESFAVNVKRQTF